MRVEVNMTTEENKFHANAWWASSPGFVVETLQRQLKAAAAIWPELEQICICKACDVKPPAVTEAAGQS